jgi:REP element-mobilizing transposase RayT
MPRQARIDTPGALHHIMVRGIERKKIFRDNKDRDDFLARLGKIVSETSTPCYAWALIPNHAHLLLRTGSAPLSHVMRRLLTGYAVRFNHRHRRHGKLFQNRYKSILCQEDPYLLELVRYIHLNPIRAGLVKDLDQLGRYRFSGHSVILGKRHNDWQDVDYVLKCFAPRRRAGRKRYLDHVRQGIEMGKRPDLVGGGLIRSLGAWSEVKSLRKRDIRLKGDERILGDSDYVLEVFKEARERFERKYELKAQGYTLDVLARRVAEIFDVTAEEILSPGKYKKRVQARSVYSYWAVRELGETASNIAKEIGISQPAVSQSVERGERLVKEMGLEL